MKPLSVLLLFCTGLTAGVLFAVALSVVPAFLAMPADSYVQAHKLIGRYFDRVMPPTVVVAALTGTVLAVSTVDSVARWLFVLGAALHVGVSAVSQFGNVPINRRVKALPAGTVPDGWVDPRRRWQAFHALRTAFALTALLVNGCAVVLVS
jgi:uncharacterized membrane protein